MNQNGVPFLQPRELNDTYRNRKYHFQDVGFYLGVIPTYVGGFMAFGWATDNKEYREIPLQELEKRLKNVTGAENLKYYTPIYSQSSLRSSQIY